MKKLLYICSFFLIFACQELVKKPKNLISKSKMSEIMADLSLNDQTMLVNPSANLEQGTRFVLQKHNVKAEDFTASFEYYTAKKSTIGIINDAQEILKERHPESEAYIEKKLKESQNPTAEIPEEKKNRDVKELPEQNLELKRDTNQIRRPQRERLQNPIRKKE